VKTILFTIVLTLKPILNVASVDGITKKYLYDRINEWHKQHPNQLAAVTLIYTIDKHLVEAPLPVTNNTFLL
jgi:hypothetical protein